MTVFHQVLSIKLGESEVPLFSTQWSDALSQGENSIGNRKQKKRTNWTPKEDMVLIYSWLNTIKDSIVGNEQKADAFWKRIAAYSASSPKVACLKRGSQVTISKGGERLMTLFASLSDAMRLQQLICLVGRIIMM